MLVRASFSLVVPIHDIITSLFYDRLFARLHPRVRRLFPDDMDGQKLKLMALLATCIGKLHDFSTLAPPAIEDLGTRHAGYGTKTEHYKILGKVLLWALNKGLGDAFTPEIRAAWIKVYNAVAATRCRRAPRTLRQSRELRCGSPGIQQSMSRGELNEIETETT